MQTSASSTQIRNEIRQIVQAHARLSIPVTSLVDESDLYDAGMTSFASVNLMLAIENRFDIEFPDRMLKRSVFESIAAISDAVMELEPHE